MADTNTTNLNLIKPEIGGAEDTWGVSINSDLDALDAIFSATGTEIDVRFNSANFDDNKKAIFGTGDDLQIYHDGTDTFIDDAGSGDLRIRSNFLKIEKYTGETMATFNDDNSVALYFNNNKKFETTSAGATVTGTLAATLSTAAQANVTSLGTLTGLTVNGDVTLTGASADIVFDKSDNALEFATNAKAVFGDSLTISRIGNSSYIHETGSGDLYIKGSDIYITDQDNNQFIHLDDDGTGGTVRLKHEGSTKLSTTSTGATLSGTLVVDHGSYTTSITGNSITFSRDTDSRILANATTSSKLLIESGDQIRSTAPSYHSWKTGSGADERVRINSSGYLLVGKTDTSFTTNGTEIRGGNLGARIIRQNAEPLTLHRQGSDGEVINLFVDSTQIGSLGTSSSDLVLTSSVSDKDIIFKGNDGGSSITALTLDMSDAGTATFNHDVKLGDDGIAKFGTGNDLQIYHDGSDSYINGLGTGNVIIRNSTDDADILFQTDNGSGSVTTYMTLDGSAVTTFFNKNTRHTDNIRATFGSSSDLQIYHDGSNSFISETGTGNLYIQGAGTIRLRGTTTEENLIEAVENGAVSLYHDNSVKLATTSTGVDVTGVLAVNSGTTDTAATFTSSDTAVAVNFVASDNSMQIATSSTDGIIKNNGAGSFRFFNNGSEKVRIDSSGRVGIGTTSIGAPLHITNATPVIRLTDSDTSRFAQIVATDGNLRFDADNNDDQSSTNISFRTDGTERARIDSSGNFGIGTTSPAQTLHVNGNAFVSGQTFLGDASGDTVTLTGSLAHASDFTIDVGGDINLDAAGNQINFKKDGTTRVTFELDATPEVSFAGGNLAFNNLTQDADIAFKGFDGSSFITALNLDMSNNGRAVFNAGAGFFDHVNFSDNAKAVFGGGDDLQIYHDGTHSYVANGTNTLYLRTASSLQIENSDGSEDLATFAVNGAVTLFHDNSYKLATTSSGINIDGGIDIKDGSSLNGTITSSSNSLTLNARNTGVLLFQSGGNEKARIDGSGNFLAGTTSSSLSSSSSATGINLNPNGASAFVRDGGTALYINRLSSDGDITQFRKDGTTVGSISTVADDLLIGTGVCGLRFHDGTPAIQPRNTNGNANNDAIDIGLSGNRFKDLHLSGVVHTGGQLKGSAASSTKLILNATSTTTELHTAGNDGLIFKGSGDNELARIDSSGNFGIGTSSPSYKFDVYGEDDITMRIHRPNSGLAATDSCGIGFSQRGDSTTSVTDTRAGIFSNYNGDLFLAVESGGNLNSNPIDHAALFIEGVGGTVGIGTTSPSSLLHLESASSPTLQIKDTTNNATFKAYAQNSNTHLANTSNHDLIIDTNNTERMRITSGGTVLIGKSALDNTTAGVRLNASGQATLARDGSLLYLNRKTTDGNSIEFAKDNSLVGSISVTGSATAYNTSSDARLKDVTGTARGLEVINKLNPVAYNWKADGKADEGLIAQEVKELVPNAVVGSEADMYSMDYSKLVVHLVAGMQEQQAIIEDLQTQLNKLKR